MAQHLHATPDAKSVASALVDAFPLDGATLSGTTLLLNRDETNIAPPQPASWREVAERINEIDFDLIYELQPEDFRYYLPGLLLGCLCHLEDKANPVVDSTFSELVTYTNDRYWDHRFIERWCRFTPAQYAVIEETLDLLYPRPSHWSIEQARQTLELIRLDLKLQESERPS